MYDVWDDKMLIDTPVFFLAPLASASVEGFISRSILVMLSKHYQDIQAVPLNTEFDISTYLPLYSKYIYMGAQDMTSVYNDSKMILLSTWSGLKSFANIPSKKSVIACSLTLKDEEAKKEILESKLFNSEHIVELTDLILLLGLNSDLVDCEDLKYDADILVIPNFGSSNDMNETLEIIYEKWTHYSIGIWFPPINGLNIEMIQLKITNDLKAKGIDMESLRLKIFTDVREALSPLKGLRCQEVYFGKTKAKLAGWNDIYHAMRKLQI